MDRTPGQSLGNVGSTPTYICFLLAFSLFICVTTVDGFYRRSVKPLPTGEWVGTTGAHHFQIAGRTRWLVECLISTILVDSSATPVTNFKLGLKLCWRSRRLLIARYWVRFPEGPPISNAHSSNQDCPRWQNAGRLRHAHQMGVKL